jgi:RND family efflux transporter MFP subunit
MRASNPNRAKFFLPILVVLGGATIAALIVRARPTVERREVTLPPPLVRVIEVSAAEVRLDVESQGTVAPATESVLAAQVAGQIESISSRFAEGGFFRRNDLLVSLDDRDYRLAVSQAEAQVAQARVRLDREEAEAELARLEWEELGGGEASPLTLREPQLAEAQAALQGAEATLEQARLQLSRTRIRAPFSGRVKTKRVDVGQFVAPATSLATLYSTEFAEIRLPVAKNNLEFLDLDLRGQTSSGPPVELTAELGGELRSWTGRIVRAGSQFDPKTRMLPLFARVEDPFALAGVGTPLPMGLFVSARIEGRTTAGVAVLPRAALREAGRVLVVDEESRLRFRTVTIVRIQSDQVVIGDGLASGEKVCISPLETVVEGMLVRTSEELGEPEATPLPKASV